MDDRDEEKSAFENVIERITPEIDEVAIMQLIREFAPDDGDGFSELLNQVAQHLRVLRAVDAACLSDLTPPHEDPNSSS